MPSGLLQPLSPPGRARALPFVELRPFAPEDAPVVRRWTIAPEEFLRVEDLLACAEVPGTVTSVAMDADGVLVAVFQSASDGDLRDAARSVALLVHPVRRRMGFGRATLLAALDQPCHVGSLLFAAIDRENAVSLRCFEACGFVADDEGATNRYQRLVCRVPAHGASGRHSRSRSVRLATASSAAA